VSTERLKDCLLITAADAQYFDLAKGCIQSVRDKPQGRELPLAFLDLGCSAEQLAWLAANVEIIREPDWEYDFPERGRTPNHVKGLLCRPFLQKYFPGYEVYLWLDADAWVQDWTAVDLFIRAARLRRGLAIVPEIDRASRYQFGLLQGQWDESEGWYAMSFGPEIGRKYKSFPRLNAGVFSLHRDAPHWKIWATAIGQSQQKAYMADQIALNLAVYDRGGFRQAELLPAWCNWTCHFGLPRWDTQRACLVEPYLPFTPIGILHLTVNKAERFRISTTEGKGIDVRLRYPAAAVVTP
jgi:lipopolysaccharide biosynthesis glycosyltransferase